jgi:hypothetical protein
MIKKEIWNFLAWHKLKPVLSKVSYLNYLHKIAIKKEKVKILKEFFESKNVLSGPFKGLKYPTYQSNGSPLLPKLVGSYEAELHEEILSALRCNYTEIIDIGCAEGYYAVGFAKNIPGAKIYAFDTDSAAQALCKVMAKTNGVESKVHVGGECSKDILSQIPIRKKALVISDCEGYEIDLFTKDLISSMNECDFLIETHDCYNPNISSELKSRFSSTHEIKSIFSCDDKEKIKFYKFHESYKIPNKYLYNLYSEERIGVTEWIICQSKI